MEKKLLLQAIDPITTAKLRYALIWTLQQKSLRLAEIVNEFSVQLPPEWSYERKDRYFDALLQKMKRNGEVASVRGRWEAK